MNTTTDYWTGQYTPLGHTSVHPGQTNCAPDTSVASDCLFYRKYEVRMIQHMRTNVLQYTDRKALEERSRCLGYTFDL